MYFQLTAANESDIMKWNIESREPKKLKKKKNILNWGQGELQ